MSEPRIPKNSIEAALPELTVLEFIDRGGQGDAWRIERNGGGPEVLKVVIGADPARVAQEIKAMQAVKSPHVMGFTEAGQLDHAGTSYPFILGEFISGKSISKRLEANEWPSEKEALAAMVGALEGIAAIHEREIVHRDIKPGNIALRNDDWQEAVILDLGLVKDMLGTSITVYPTLLGTVPFMAPEQLRQERAVRRSDVFAAAVTLFLLLTKQHPFLDPGEQNVAIEVLEERINDNDRPKWSGVLGIEDDVRDVLTRMLKPSAYERPRADVAAAVIRAILESR
jgi:serine/threonine protein kinase